MKQEPQGEANQDRASSQPQPPEPAAADPGVLRALLERVTEFMQSVEKGELAEYGRYLSSPGRVVLVNFLGGVARGVGIAIGFTLVAAITLYLLTKLAALNIPVIGAFIADITRIVQYQLRVH